MYASIMLTEAFQALYFMFSTVKRSSGASALNPSSDSPLVIQCELADAHAAHTRATNIRVSAPLDMQLYLLTSHS